MRQKGNETVLLIWSAPHGPFIGSTQSSNGSPALASPEKMRSLADDDKRRCEIQCEAIEFSEEYKWIHDLH